MQHDQLQANTSRPLLPVFLVSCLLALLIPPLVFTMVALAEGMGVSGAASALVEQYQAERQNLGILGAVGLIPLALMAIVIVLLRFAKRLQAKRRHLAVGGACGILLILVWVNFQFWPVFLPNRTNPGFPHGLEFVIGPLIFAPIAMVVGILVAGFTSGRRGPP